MWSIKSPLFIFFEKEIKENFVCTFSVIHNVLLPPIPPPKEFPLLPNLYFLLERSNDKNFFLENAYERIWTRKHFSNNESKKLLFYGVDIKAVKSTWFMSCLPIFRRRHRSEKWKQKLCCFVDILLCSPRWGYSRLLNTFGKCARIH